MTYNKIKSYHLQLLINSKSQNSKQIIIFFYLNIYYLIISE